MFAFENVLVCRSITLNGSELDAHQITRAHPAQTQEVFIVGYLLTPGLKRKIGYTIEVEGSGGGSLGVELSQRYTMRPKATRWARLLVARIPVRGVLAPATYQVIINVEGRLETRIGFELI